MSDNARYETLAELEASEEFPKEAGFSRGLSLDAARGLVDKYWPD